MNWNSVSDNFCRDAFLIQYNVTKKIYIFDIGSLHMSSDQNKRNAAGTKEVKLGSKAGESEDPDLSIAGVLRRFYDRHMKPQGEDGHYSIVHDVVVAFIVVLIIVIAIYGYTRTWPPVVVVESGSMQHSSDQSSLGVIDTGDIVMVKQVSSTNDITPWSIGKGKDYETYGEYGDVIIYDKNGEGGTPVIHRAIVFLQHNETVGGTHYFDVPEWNIYHNRTIEYYIAELNLQINYTPQRGHDGYLTKGDNQMTNRRVDQQSGISDANGRIVEQVSIEWVIGVARGEIPWFGLIKLYVNDNPGFEKAPDNAKTNLKVSLVLLLGIPIILNVFYYAFAAKYGTLDEKDGNQTASKTSGKSPGVGKERKSEKERSKREEKVKIGKRGGH